MKASTVKLRCLAVLLLGTVALTNGCATEKEPTYADLVVIYNAELDALDRLEKQKQELIRNHEAELRPSADDAVQALGEVLNSAAGLKQEVDPEAELDPNQALDQAVANAQNAQDVVSQLVDSVNRPAEENEEDIARHAAITAEFEKQLAALNEEIEVQKQRVERARQARDAAESR